MFWGNLSNSTYHCAHHYGEEDFWARTGLRYEFSQHSDVKLIVHLHMVSSFIKWICLYANSWFQESLKNWEYIWIVATRKIFMNAWVNIHHSRQTRRDHSRFGAYWSFQTKIRPTVGALGGKSEPIWIIFSIVIAAPTLAEKIQCSDTRSKLPFDICQFPYCSQARLIWKIISKRNICI